LGSHKRHYGTIHIENPADCKERAVIRFLSTKCFKAAHIHRQISGVYGENNMSNGMVRKWLGPLKIAAQTFMMRNEVGDNNVMVI